MHHADEKYCYYNQVVTFRYLSNLVVEVLCTMLFLFFVETSGQRCQESHCQDSPENSQSRRQGRQICVATVYLVLSGKHSHTTGARISRPTVKLTTTLCRSHGLKLLWMVTMVHCANHTNGKSIVIGCVSSKIRPEKNLH